MGICFFRPAYRHKKGQAELRTFQEVPDKRRFCHVSVFHIHQALQQPRKCRRAYKKGKIVSATQRRSGYFFLNRQTIRHDRNIPKREPREKERCSPAIGVILI